jgi:hypothetical protein
MRSGLTTNHQPLNIERTNRWPTKMPMIGVNTASNVIHDIDGPSIGMDYPLRPLRALGNGTVPQRVQDCNRRISGAVRQRRVPHRVDNRT